LDDVNINKLERKNRIKKMILFVVVCLLLHLISALKVHGAEESSSENDTVYIQLSVRIKPGGTAAVKESKSRQQTTVQGKGADGLILGKIRKGDKSVAIESDSKPLTVRIEGLDGVRPLPEQLLLTAGETGSFRIPVSEEGTHRFRVVEMKDVKQNIECTNCVYVVYAESRRGESGELDTAVWITKDGKEGKVDEISFISGDGDEEGENDPSPTAGPTPTTAPDPVDTQPTETPADSDRNDPKTSPAPINADLPGHDQNSSDPSPGWIDADRNDSGNTSGGVSSGLRKLVASVMTGDESNLVLYAVVLLISSIFAVLLSRLNRKDRE
jgi:hypothetical protein